MPRTKATAIARIAPVTTAEFGGLDYETMTADQLEAENNKMTAIRDAVREEQRRLTAVLDRKLTAKRMADKLASLSDSERAALTQLVAGAGGIESEEEFGAGG